MMHGEPSVKICSTKLIDLLMGTERINLVFNCSRGSLKVCAELCYEEETNLFSILKICLDESWYPKNKKL